MKMKNDVESRLEFFRQIFRRVDGDTENLQVQIHSILGK